MAYLAPGAIAAIVICSVLGAGLLVVLALAIYSKKMCGGWKRVFQGKCKRWAGYAYDASTVCPPSTVGAQVLVPSYSGSCPAGKSSTVNVFNTTMCAYSNLSAAQAAAAADASVVGIVQISVAKTSGHHATHYYLTDSVPTCMAAPAGVSVTSRYYARST